MSDAAVVNRKKIVNRAMKTVTSLIIKAYLLIHWSLDTAVKIIIVEN